MRQLLTLLSCLFFALKPSAQSTLNTPHLQFGGFVGTGRTHYEDKSYKGGLGYDIGLAVIRKNKKRNRRLEMNLSYSRWNFKSDKVYQTLNPVSDTFFIQYRKAGFLDFALKTNIKVYTGDNYRLYLAGGLTIGTFMSYYSRSESYLTASNSLIKSGDWGVIKPLTNTLIGVEYGFINEIPIGEKWVLSADLLILSKITFEVFGANGPFKFQQLRIGFRKAFGEK